MDFLPLRELHQSTVKATLPNNESYESKTGCNRTPATLLWAPLTPGAAEGVNVSVAFFPSSGAGDLRSCLRFVSVAQPLDPPVTL